MLSLHTESESYKGRNMLFDFIQLAEPLREGGVVRGVSTPSPPPQHSRHLSICQMHVRLSISGCTFVFTIWGVKTSYKQEGIYTETVHLLCISEYLKSLTTLPVIPAH